MEFRVQNSSGGQKTQWYKQKLGSHVISRFSEKIFNGFGFQLNQIGSSKMIDWPHGWWPTFKKSKVIRTPCISCVFKSVTGGHCGKRTAVAHTHPCLCPHSEALGVRHQDCLHTNWILFQRKRVEILRTQSLETDAPQAKPRILLLLSNTGPTFLQPMDTKATNP